MKAMTRDRNQTTVQFGTGEKIAIAGLFLTLLGVLAGAYAIYREHDRDLAVLKAETQTMRMDIKEVKADGKELLRAVAGLEAVLRDRRADSLRWPLPYEGGM